MPLFQKNLEPKGRAVRAVGAALLALAAAVSWPHSPPAAIALATAAAFVAFEAGRGWCALRACGIRTKL